jgi:hypothetical protein
MVREKIFYKRTLKFLRSTGLKVITIALLIRQFLQLCCCVGGINAHCRRKISLVHLSTSTALLSGQASEAKTTQNTSFSTKKLQDFFYIFIKINHQSPSYRHKA